MEIPFVTVTKQNFLQKPYGHLRAVHLVVTFQTQPFSTSMPMGERVNILSFLRMGSLIGRESH